MLTIKALSPRDAPSVMIRTGLDAIGPMTACRSTGLLVDLLLKALQPFGVVTYAMVAAVDPARIDPLASMLSNASSEWARIYRSGRRALYDPIMQEAARQPGHFFSRDIAIALHAPVRMAFRQARQYGMIDGLTRSPRVEWPVVAALTLSGVEFTGGAPEANIMALIAQTFMSRCMYLRAHAVIPTVLGFSDQERRLLQAAADAIPDKVTARDLGMPRHMITTHWTPIRDKLGAQDRAQAVAIALWSGELSLS